MAKERTIKVKFQNLEMPGTRLDFTLDGVVYGLEHNREYDLPIPVIEHLNGLQVPDPYWEVDEETGQLRHHTDRVRNRFNCQILNLKDLLDAAEGKAVKKTAKAEPLPEEVPKEEPGDDHPVAQEESEQKLTGHEKQGSKAELPFKRA